jgi:transcriptional regulator with XRE-family HTH domain
MVEWGSVIKRLREERGLSQTELAKRSGVTRGYIAQIEIVLVKESGMDIFRRLAEALGMSLNELDTAVRGKPLTPADNPDDLLARHTAAHLCRKNGMTIEEIQYLLGHSSAETTRNYLGTFDPTNQMIAAHRRASPVDNFLGRGGAKTRD